MVNSPMDREESIDYATYLVLNEALTKGFVEMSLLGKFSRIPGFDKSAIGMMKGQIKDIAQSAIDSPIESKKQLELLKSQLDMKRIESLYLPADVKDYVEMIVHAKIYRAFKEGIETDKAFIWKRILIPILEQRSDEIYNKRQVILNGFLDAPISIYEKIYNKYVPLNPDKIEMLENKLETYGIPINFPHTPDDLMNVDIQTGIIEDTKDRVVVRFAPTPNGPLSIGHSRGVCLLGEYEKRYPGAKLLLRFDDTDPAKSTDLSEYGIPDVFQQIIDEMEWLLDTDIPKRNIIIASERFTLYQNEVINAIRNGKAVCDTRRDGLVSGVDNNLSVFASMLKGEYAAGEAAVKLTASIPKGDLSKDYDNRAGEILFRMVEYDGENLCVPLMNLQSVVDDKMTGVTHIVRGADHDGGNLGRQKKIWSEMGYGQFPFVDNWGLVALTDDQEYNTYITSKEFDDKHDRIDTTLAEKAGKMGILTTRISTSRMRKGMNEGLYSENQFQSPELPTLTSLKHEHLYMENSKPITSEAIRAYWNIVRHNQDVTAIFNREELRQLNERMSKGGYVFEEKAYADEQERRDYIKGLKMQDRYYAEEDEENKPSKISGLMLANPHWIPMYKKTKKEGESFDAWYERFMFRKSAESFDAEDEPTISYWQVSKNNPYRMSEADISVDFEGRKFGGKISEFDEEGNQVFDAEGRCLLKVGVRLQANLLQEVKLTLMAK
jgi:glutamyl/glutaminyl-tRNA synthetase